MFLGWNGIKHELLLYFVSKIGPKKKFFAVNIKNVLHRWLVYANISNVNDNHNQKRSCEEQICR